MPNVKINESYPQVTEDQLLEIENRIGRLPEQYRNFIIKNNGGRPKPNVFPIPKVKYPEEVDWFLGVHNGEHDNLIRYIEVYKGRIPNELIPIAHDSGGNLILIGTKEEHTGKIYYWDHEKETGPSWDNIVNVADSFNEFLNSFGSLEDFE